MRKKKEEGGGGGKGVQTRAVNPPLFFLISIEKDEGKMRR